jgi:hypothetical protein
MKVKVRDVHPNPYRNIDHYPLNKEKIMALTKSIEKTGFWDNLVGRQVDGQIQIAYGHHRIEALRLAEGYGYDFEFDLPIKDIDNATMIQIMANENMSEWGHDITVIDETVKTTKEFLEKDFAFLAAKSANMKDHPNVRWDGKASGKDIANFLGWSVGKVTTSLRRIDAIESGKVSKVALETFQPEKSKHFLSSIEKHDFTPKEQESIAKELVEKDVSRDDFKKVIEAKAFEKKYGDNFGKKKAEAVDKKLQEFDTQLGFIAKDITNLSDKFLKLTTLKNELESVTSKKGLFNLKILFMAFGNLKTRMEKFEKAMTENTEDITEDFIEEVKQLNK